MLAAQHDDDKQKKIQLLVDFAYEICLDSKFPVREEIWKISTIIRNSINYFESFN